MTSSDGEEKVNGSSGHSNGDWQPGGSRTTSSTVIVIGGGPVGCLLAYKLGRAGIGVTIIEKGAALSDSPRACGYYGAVQPVLAQLDLYDKIREAGFMTRGLCWRKKPRDNGKGGKSFGEMIACQPLCQPDDTELAVGAGLLNLPQADVNKLFLREALATEHVQIRFSTELVSIIQNDGTGVTALVRNVETQAESQLEAKYLIGADGARSATRKALGLPFPGHTWPERLISTNVYVQNDPDYDPVWHTFYVLDRINYTIATPLEEPTPGNTTLWRYTFATDPADTRTDEEVCSEDNIMRQYEKVMAGPRPLQVKIQARSPYRIHQRLAPTMRRGRCLLAGDAAHANNPYGALGLNTGILDADALGEALIMILKENCPSSVLDIYSDERRKVFMTFVDPTSTQNKLRVHSNDEDTAAQDDWYFRLMSDPSKLTPQQIQEFEETYFVKWRTDMRKLAADHVKSTSQVVT